MHSQEPDGEQGYIYNESSGTPVPQSVFKYDCSAAAITSRRNHFPQEDTQAPLS